MAYNEPLDTLEGPINVQISHDSAGNVTATIAKNGKFVRQLRNDEIEFRLTKLLGDDPDPMTANPVKMIRTAIKGGRDLNVTMEVKGQRMHKNNPSQPRVLPNDPLSTMKGRMQLSVKRDSAGNVVADFFKRGQFIAQLKNRDIETRLASISFDNLTDSSITEPRQIVKQGLASDGQYIVLDFGRTRRHLSSDKGSNDSRMTRDSMGSGGQSKSGSPTKQGFGHVRQDNAYPSTSQKLPAPLQQQQPSRKTSTATYGGESHQAPTHDSNRQHTSSPGHPFELVEGSPYADVTWRINGPSDNLIKTYFDEHKFTTFKNRIPYNTEFAQYAAVQCNRLFWASAAQSAICLGGTESVLTQMAEGPRTEKAFLFGRIAEGTHTCISPPVDKTSVVNLPHGVITQFVQSQVPFTYVTHEAMRTPQH
eukprot:Selendium_serpulae@DN3439_c0_g1_i1.p1